MKERTGTKIAEDEMNPNEVAGSRCRDGFTLIELLVMIAKFSRRGVCATERFANLAWGPPIRGHNVCSLCSSRLRARCTGGVSSQASGNSSLKGTAVAPHCRAKIESSKLGAFFIGIAPGPLAVELGVDQLGQPERIPAIKDLDAVQFEGIQAQLHFQRAQAQVHFLL